MIELSTAEQKIIDSTLVRKTQQHSCCWWVHACGCLPQCSCNTILMQPMKPYEWHTNRGMLLDQSNEPSFNKVLKRKDKLFDIHDKWFNLLLLRNTHNIKKLRHNKSHPTSLPSSQAQHKLDYCQCQEFCTANFHVNICLTKN